MRCMVLGDDAAWLAQLRKGSVEHCVLALLRHGERYGFDLARSLAEDGVGVFPLPMLEDELN